MNVVKRKPAGRKPALFVTATLVVLLLVITAYFLSWGKNNEDKAKEDITAVIDKFAAYYFNFDFNNTAATCTPESMKWLSFISSNILQEDIDIIKAQKEGPWHETVEVTLTSDTTATAECKVFNFLKIDTLGCAGRIAEQATYKIPAVKRNGKWLVKMEGLLQNERQNRD